MLCPRKCAVNRSIKKGICGCTDKIIAGAAVVHRGEEPPLTGQLGSGTVFFSGCHLKCSYCQNMQISHGCMGQELNETSLADCFLMLQEKGCANINLVTPTHFSPQIIESLDIAKSRGLYLPIVINSGGYESIETLEMWKDHAAIWLMDIKYGDNATGKLLSNVKDYWDVSRQAVSWIFERFGPLVTDASDLAASGLIIRHLVLPGMLSNPFSVLEFIAALSTGIPVSIMSQYSPAFYTGELPEMKRTLLQEEYDTVIERAVEMGFETIYAQDIVSHEVYMPDFAKPCPFNDCKNILMEKTEVSQR